MGSNLPVSNYCRMTPTELTSYLPGTHNLSRKILHAGNARVNLELLPTMTQHNKIPNSNNRRSFLKRTLTAGAALAGASALTSNGLLAQGHRRLTRGDAAILQFLAAAELIEADLWQQYAELGGVTTGPQNAYQNALQNLDSDGSQYISSNTLDEQSHAQFLN